jgi:hypothetical protein
MKTSNAFGTVLATWFALSATAASAQLSRADVVAQRNAAQAAGQLGVLYGEDSGSAYLASHFRPLEDRDEVKTALGEAIKAGTLTVLVRTDSGSFYLSRHQMLRTPRAEVSAALATAEKEGTLEQFHGEDSGSFALSQQRTGADARAMSRPWRGWSGSGNS